MRYIYKETPRKEGFSNRKALPILENIMTTLEVTMKEGNESLCEKGYEALSTYCYYEEKSRTLRIQMLLFNKDQRKNSMTLVQSAFREACGSNKSCEVRVFENSYVVSVSGRKHAQAITEILEKECFGERNGIKDAFKQFVLFTLSFFR